MNDVDMQMMIVDLQAQIADIKMEIGQLQRVPDENTEITILRRVVNDSQSVINSYLAEINEKDRKIYLLEEQVKRLKEYRI